MKKNSEKDFSSKFIKNKFLLHSTLQNVSRSNTIIQNFADKDHKNEETNIF